MYRGRRTIRVAKWAGVSLRVLIVAAWLVSMSWAFGFDAGQRFTAMIESGVFVALWADAPADGFSGSAEGQGR